MNSFCSARFWKHYNDLPFEVRELADKGFLLWKENPRHPSLQFKALKKDVWSVRVGIHYRAIAHVDGQDVIWVWIGHHSEYDHII